MTFIELCAIGVIVGSLTITSYLVIKDGSDWSEFIQRYECMKIGQATGMKTTEYSIGHGGQSVATSTSTLGKNVYLCNNGVTYWR